LIKNLFCVLNFILFFIYILYQWTGLREGCSQTTPWISVEEEYSTWYNARCCWWW